MSRSRSKGYQQSRSEDGHESTLCLRYERRTDAERRGHCRRKTGAEPHVAMALLGVAFRGVWQVDPSRGWARWKTRLSDQIRGPGKSARQMDCPMPLHRRRPVHAAARPRSAVGQGRPTDVSLAFAGVFGPACRGKTAPSPAVAAQKLRRANRREGGAGQYTLPATRGRANTLPRTYRRPTQRPKHARDNEVLRPNTDVQPGNRSRRRSARHRGGPAPFGKRSSIAYWHARSDRPRHAR